MPAAGGELHFKVKSHTKFEKIFNVSTVPCPLLFRGAASSCVLNKHVCDVQAYATKKAIAAGTLKFLFDGKRLRESQTPGAPLL